MSSPAPPPPERKQPPLPQSPESEGAALETLTARQKQILSLLQAGKGNKEIASELGLHVGTVKQHVVALFKKLNVRNRAMAVARSASSGPDQEISPILEQPSVASAPFSASLVETELGHQDSLLEKRPCIILSLSIGPRDSSLPLPETLTDSARRAGGRCLHACLAALAYDYDAVLLARRGHAADIIFGLQHTSEHDLLHAIRSAQAVAADLQATAPQAAPHLCGGLTAGLAVASMKRFGGWSGEAVASAGISAARTLSLQAAAGTLVVDAAAWDLMASVGIGVQNTTNVDSIAEHGPLRTIPFKTLPHLKVLQPSHPHPLRGRTLELSSLYASLDHARHSGLALALVTGEAGMGKSHISQAFAQRCSKDGIPVFCWRCQPSDALSLDTESDSVRITCDADGNDTSLEHILAHIQQQAAPTGPSVVILDDVHWLPLMRQGDLLRALSQLLQSPRIDGGGLLVVLLTRRFRPALHPLLPVGERVHTIALARLPQQTIATIASDRLGSLPATSPSCTTVAERAMGVPLFAVEMTRHGHSGVFLRLPSSRDTFPLTLPLSLLSLISARLDPLGLDRALLRILARSPVPLSVADLAARLSCSGSVLLPSIERAVFSGVLSQSEPMQMLSFSHPLLRTVVNALALDQPS